jgi:hypothetical protein
MAVLEEAVRDRGLPRIGLSVSLDDDAAPARTLYERLGFAHAHGPFVSSTDLIGDDGPIAVGARDELPRQEPVTSASRRSR